MNAPLNVKSSADGEYNSFVQDFHRPVLSWIWLQLHPPVPLYSHPGAFPAILFLVAGLQPVLLGLLPAGLWATWRRCPCRGLPSVLCSTHERPRGLVHSRSQWFVLVWLNYVGWISWCRWYLPQWVNLGKFRSLAVQTSSFCFLPRRRDGSRDWVRRHLPEPVCAS